MHTFSFKLVTPESRCKNSHIQVTVKKKRLTFRNCRLEFIWCKRREKSVWKLLLINNRRCQLSPGDRAHLLWIMASNCSLFSFDFIKAEQTLMNFHGWFYVFVWSRHGIVRTRSCVVHMFLFYKIQVIKAGPDISNDINLSAGGFCFVVTARCT